MGTKKVVFLDRAVDADFFVSKNRDNLSDCVLISMHPSVDVYCREKGIEIHDTIRYFTADSHVNALRRSREIVDWFLANSKFEDMGLNVKFAYRDMFLYWMRFGIHECIWMIEIISNAICLHSPDILCASLSNPQKTSSLYIEPQEKCLGKLVAEIAARSNLEFEDISEGAYVSRDRTESNLGGYFQDHVMFIIKYLNFRFLEFKITLENFLFKKKTIFFTSYSYQLKGYADGLMEKNHGTRLILLPSPVIPSSVMERSLLSFGCGRYSIYVRRQRSSLSDLSEAIKSAENIFSHRGIPFSGVISQKIMEGLKDFIISLMVWTIKLDRFIERTNPYAVVTNGTRDDDVVLAEICGRKKIPDILISHGTFVEPFSEAELIEWGEFGRLLLRGPYTHLALQTPLSEGYLRVFPAAGEILRTGPLIWGMPVNRQQSRDLFNQIFKGKREFGKTKVIIHAGTPKPSKSARFYVFETPHEYIKAIRDLALAVERLQDTVLIVKFRPTSEISLDDMRTLVPFSDKVILMAEGSFLEALGMADLFASYSSTTIEEALQNRVPVLLYGGEGRYRHVTGQEVKAGIKVARSAAYHVKSASDLGYAIVNILKLGRVSDDAELFDEFIYKNGSREPLERVLKL